MFRLLRLVITDIDFLLILILIVRFRGLYIDLS